MAERFTQTCERAVCANTSMVEMAYEKIIEYETNEAKAFNKVSTRIVHVAALCWSTVCIAPASLKLCVGSCARV